MMIRLIEVVLVVLFGFIVISDIDIKGSLRLPSKQSLEKKAVVPERKIPVYIEIGENNFVTINFDHFPFRFNRNVFIH